MRPLSGKYLTGQSLQSPFESPKLLSVRSRMIARVVASFTRGAQREYTTFAYSQRIGDDVRGDTRLGCEVDSTLRAARRIAPFSPFGSPLANVFARRPVNVHEKTHFLTVCSEKNNERQIYSSEYCTSRKCEQVHDRTACFHSDDHQS